jgi:23S rRNA-/tRNA-specific pseudouridylate synthase
LQKFDFEVEFLLLNRLDNETGWLLYFAKNEKIYDKFKKLQEEWKVEKIYVADVYWKIPDFWRNPKRLKKFEESLFNNEFTGLWFKIKFPIKHHKYLKDRKVAIKRDKDLNKWRWKLHQVETEIIPLYYDKEKNQTTVYAIIKRWIRHQIRVHLASIWYPIVWDKIYAKKIYPKDWMLHLWSIGLHLVT